MTDFHAEYQGEWPPPTEEERQAHKAAQACLDACDRYDVQVCGPDGMPKTGEHRRCVQEHARDARRIALEHFGVTAEAFQRAMQRLHREREHGRKSGT